VNPIFQILQMDPGAEKYIGFAKSECRRLMANGTQDFFRTWNLGDATVDAKSYGGSVKLWLKAGLMKLYYDGAVTMPCPGRTLSIVVAKAVVPSVDVVFSHTVSLPNSGHQDFYDYSLYVNGIVVDRGTGSVTVTQTITYSNWITTESGMVTIKSNFGASVVSYSAGHSWYLANGSADNYVYVSPITGSISGTPYGEYDSAVAARASKNQTIILLSDGTQLASFPYTVLDTAGHKANYPLYTAWSGDGWLDLYTDTLSGSTWTPVFSQRVTFVVPQDVVIQENTDPTLTSVPTIVLGAYSQVVSADGTYIVSATQAFNISYNSVNTSFSGSLQALPFDPINNARYYTYTNYPSGGLIFNGTSGPGGTLSATSPAAQQGLLVLNQRNRDWIAAQLVALNRERARRKTCSDNLKAQLMGWQVDGVPIYQTTQWLDAQKADVTAYMADQSKGLSYTTVTAAVAPDTGSYVETATSKVKITGVLSTAGALANEVRYPAKTIHPRSLNTYMPGNFSVQITNSTLSNDSEGSSNQQKTVVVRYTPLKDENNNQPTDITETLTGTKNTVVTRYTANGVAKAGSSTSVTYTKWVDVKVNGDNISVPTLNLAWLFNDVSNAPLLRVMNGATVASPGPYDGSGYVYTPAPPVNSNTVTLGTPDTFKQFRTDYKPKYDKTTTLGAYAVKVLGIFTVTAVDATLSAETVQKTVTWVYQPPSIPVPAINGVEQEPTKPPTTTMQNVGTRRIQVLAYATQTTYTNWMGVPAFNPIGKTDAQKEAAALASFVFRVNGVDFVSAGIYQSGTGPAPTYTPIYTIPPSSYDSTVLDTHPFFATDTKIKTAFLDSKLVEGEIITVIPVSTYHSTLGDLGMFPYADDIPDKTKLTLKVDMQAKFKYKYIDGSFTFAGSKQKTIPLDDIGVPSSPAPTGVTYTKGVDGKYYISLNHITDKNAVFLSSVNKSAGWPDVMGKPATTAIPATDTTPAIPATTPATYSYLYQQNRLKDPSPSPVLTADEQFLQTISKLSFS
jgi:hypothetical protein